MNNSAAAASQHATNPKSVHQILDILNRSAWKIREGEDFETDIANESDGHVYCRIVALGDSKYLVYDTRSNPPALVTTIQSVAEYISRRWW